MVNNMEKTTHLTFKEAYQQMLNGKKVSRKCFKGYWHLNQETGAVMIHLPARNGKPEEDISYGRLDVTIKNTLADDWYVVEEE